MMRKVHRRIFFCPVAVKQTPRSFLRQSARRGGKKNGGVMLLALKRDGVGFLPENLRGSRAWFVESWFSAVLTGLIKIFVRFVQFQIKKNRINTQG